MVAIGAYELAVMKEIKLAGGAVPCEEPSLPAAGGTMDDLILALEKLEQAEYLERAQETFRLTELALEYLSVLGFD